MTDAPGAGVPENEETPPKGRPGMGRSTAIMASGTAVSRVLGFVRNALLAAAIGVNAGAANAYEVANKIPNALFAIMAAGVLNAVLVPQIVRAFQREDGKRTVDRILTLGGVISLAVTVLFTLAAGLMVQVYSDNWPPELVALATAMALWCIPQLFFYGIYTLLGQVLNARGQFGPFMWAPVLNNVVGIAGLVAYLAIFGQYVAPAEGQISGVLTETWTPGRIALLAGVATAGIAAQAAILIWPLLRGGYHWRWVWRGPKGELRAVRVVAGWALAAVLLEQVGVVLTSRVATAANPGDLDPSIAGNMAYYQALMLYLVPHSLITVSLVTVLYTSMSRLAAAGDMNALRAEVSRGLRLIGVFTLYASVALVVLAPLIVRIALPSEDPVVIISVAQVLVAMSLGLVPLGAMVLLKQVFFVLEDGKSVFLIHVPMTLTWVGIAYAARELLDPQWWVVAVGLGLAASNLVAFVFRTAGLRRRLGGIEGRRVASVYGRAVVATVLSGAAGWALTRMGPDVADLTGADGVGVAVVLVLGIAAVMFAIYGGILTLLRVQEWKDIVAPVTSRLRRRVR